MAGAKPEAEATEEGFRDALVEVMRQYNDSRETGEVEVVVIKPVMYVTEKGHPGIVCSVGGVAFIVSVSKTLINIEALIQEDHQ